MNRNSAPFPPELRRRLDEEYSALLEEISRLTPQECLEKSEEITLCKNLYHAFSHENDWNQENLQYLGQFSHPLRMVCSWARYEWFDWDETLRHILWNIRNKQGRENPVPESQEEQ